MVPSSTDTMSASSQPMPFFTKCCFCIPLRVGCFILGYLSLIINLVATAALTIYITSLAVSTHSFDHLDYYNEANNSEPTVHSTGGILLHHMAILLIMNLLVNVTWLAIHIVNLVGLHKKRSGLIRTFVAFATLRLVFYFVTYVFMFAEINTQLIFHVFEFGLASYFIFVYYTYAKLIEHENKLVQTPQEKIPSIYTTDIGFIYPPKMDKEKLIV